MPPRRKEDITLTTPMSELVHAEKLTSLAFGNDNLPKDWCDVILLVPHEGIRTEMNAMVKSANALTDSVDAWKVVYFCEWFVDWFYPFVHSHHDAEELLYFPWIETRAKLPSKSLSEGHEVLMKMMGDMKKFSETVMEKGGISCETEIDALKKVVPNFVETMNDHLKEEELVVPPILREHFTKEEENAIFTKIVKNAGLYEAKVGFWPIMTAMEHWATPAFCQNTLEDVPGPIKHLAFKYYKPDYDHVCVPMRDAPLLTEKPTLEWTPCCGIPFCFKCII